MDRLSGKPFVILGVNSDQDREALKETLREEEITWRSWWDDGSIHGPIHTKWQIVQRPAIHLIDHEGVIRYRGIPVEDLDEAIEALLAEVAQDSKQ